MRRCQAPDTSRSKRLATSVPSAYPGRVNSFEEHMDSVLRGSPFSAAHVLSWEKAVHLDCEANSPGDDRIQDLPDGVRRAIGRYDFG